MTHQVRPRMVDNVTTVTRGATWMRRLVAPLLARRLHLLSRKPHAPFTLCYSSAMRYVCRSRISGSLIALFMAVALLLPEAGHGLAHHHAAEHHGPSLTAHHGGAPGDLLMADEQAVGRHPHLDLVATPAGKPLLVHATVVRAVALLLPEIGEERPLPTLTTGLSPGRRNHGPPPPSRAPPQV